MYFRKELQRAVYEILNLGYKRQKALDYIANKIGVRPLEYMYVECLHFVFDRKFDKAWVAWLYTEENADV